MRCAAGEFIKVNGNAQLLSDALAETAGQIDALVHRDAGDGDERNDINGADARMRAAVLRHVDELNTLLDQLECRFENRFRFSDEGDDCSIGVRARIDVEERDAGD